MRADRQAGITLAAITAAATNRHIDDLQGRHVRQWAKEQELTAQPSKSSAAQYVRDLKAGHERLLGVGLSALDLRAHLDTAIDTLHAATEREKGTAAPMAHCQRAITAAAALYYALHADACSIPFPAADTLSSIGMTLLFPSHSSDTSTDESETTMPLKSLTEATPATDAETSAEAASPVDAFKSAVTTPAPTKGGALAAIAAELDAAHDLTRKLQDEVSAYRATIKDLESRPSISTMPTAKPAPTVREEDVGRVPAPTVGWMAQDHDSIVRDLASRRIPLMLVGPPGTGKSSAPREACAALGLPFDLFPCNESADADSAIQRREIDDGSTTASDGSLAWAARYGGAACLDELGAMAPSAQAALHDWLAGGNLSLPWTNEQLAGSDAWITATSNLVGSDRTDTSHEQMPTAALLDRFAIIEVGHPSEEQEAALLQSMAGMAPSEGEEYGDKTLKEMSHAEVRDMAKPVAGLLADLRAAWESGDLSGCYSPRRGADLLRFMRWWGGTAKGKLWALRAALIDRHSPSERETVKAMIQRRLGVKA